MNAEIEILKILFPPEGAVPLDRLNEINLIRGHIDVAIKLSQGFHPQRTGLAARYYDPEESQRITEKVVELRESLGPDGKRRSWPAIAAEAGNITPKAARMRYWKYCQDRKAEEMRKEAYAALSGEPAHSDPTIWENRIVEHPEECPMKSVVEQSNTSTRVGRKPPKIPHEMDDYIVDLREHGSMFREIQKDLNQQGIECTVDDVIARYNGIKKRRDDETHGNMPHNSLTPKERGRQEQINSAAAVASSDKDKSDPVPISRSELDQKIWSMWKTGMSPKQISEALNLEGYYYGEQSVRVRLRAQGADL